jgi:cytoskeletal protein CcmA (bactofilin family)
MLIFPIGIFVKSGESVTITKPVNDDMYVAGGTVVVNAPIHGDLIVVGGNVTINDSVYYDLIVAGGTVIINGYVGDDLRCTGGTIHLSQQVNDDAVLAGGKVLMDRNAVVGGNLLVTGGQLQLSGTVKSNLMTRSGELEFNGLVEGDADFRGEELKINGIVTGSTALSGRAILIEPDASFKGDVRFWHPDGKLDMGNSMAQGQAAYDESLKMETANWKWLGFSSILLLFWYLGTALLMIFLIQYLFGSTLEKAAITVLKESPKSLGYGLLFCFGLPIAIVVSCISVVGIPIGIILVFSMITLIILATVITALIAVHWINHVYYASSWKSARIIFTAFGLFIVLKLVTLTPFIGPLVMMLLIFLAYGAILLNINWKRKSTIVS